MNKILLFLTLAAAGPAGILIAGNPAGNFELARSLAQRTEGKVFRDSVVPHWLPDNRHFWYRVTTGPEIHEYVLVDARTGEIKRAGGLEQLGLPKDEHLSTAAPRARSPKRTLHTGNETIIRMNNTTAAPVDIFWVDQAGQRQTYGRVRPGQIAEFETYAGHVWLVTDALGSPLGFFEATAEPLEVDIDGKPAKPASPSPRQGRRRDGQSPDKNWTVQFTNQNILLVAATGETTALTTNGTREHPYRGPVVWSPDSQHCVVLSVREVPRRQVSIVQSSPPDQLQPKLLQFDYVKPGDPLPQVQLVLIQVASRTAQIIPDTLFTNAFTPDGELAVR